MRHFVFALFIVSCASTGDNAGCGSKPAPAPQEPERSHCRDGAETCRQDICIKSGLMEGGVGFRTCLETECVKSGGTPRMDGDVCEGGLGRYSDSDGVSQNSRPQTYCERAKFVACVTCYVEPNNPYVAQSRLDHVCRGLENANHPNYKRAVQACTQGGDYVYGYNGQCPEWHLEPSQHTQNCVIGWSTETFRQQWSKQRGCHLL